MAGIGRKRPGLPGMQEVRAPAAGPPGEQAPAVPA